MSRRPVLQAWRFPEVFSPNNMLYSVKFILKMDMMMKLRSRLFKFAAIKLNCVVAIGRITLSYFFFFFMSLCFKFIYLVASTNEKGESFWGTRLMSISFSHCSLTKKVQATVKVTADLLRVRLNQDAAILYWYKPWMGYMIISLCIGMDLAGERNGAKWNT